MKQDDKVEAEIARILGCKVGSCSPVSGGCIASAYKVKMTDGRRLFAKTGGGEDVMFLREANGLKELSKPAELRVPQVWHAAEGLLLLEWIEPGTRGRDFFVRFGRSLARLHRFHGDGFGFWEDNFIGATTQWNAPQMKWEPAARDSSAWAHFYFERRLLHQYKLLESKGYADDVKILFKRMEPRVYEILSGCPAEPPTLLHGDLWSGNYLVDDKGEPCLIDPAVYYGDREADLAMTALFGGFPADFYRAYGDEYPLRAQHSEREPLYQLYHIMNHVNLFGGSYWAQMRDIMRGYQ